MNLKKLRTYKGISQKSVADGVGCSPTVYSRYENGERQPSIEMLIALSKFFGVSVDYIINNPTIETSGFSKAEIELVMAARESDERARTDALTLLKNHPSSPKKDMPEKETET